MRHTHISNRAFSLVELSIVLVILGLLVGGVLAGKSLIESAAMRSQIVQLQSASAAIQQFRDKYFNLPGDMLTADVKKFNLPYDNSNHGDFPEINGDGSFNASWGGLSGNEFFDAEATLFWPQLASAQLIQGGYTYQGSNSYLPGVTMPAMKLTPALGILPYTPTAPSFTGNSFILGVPSAVTGGCICWANSAVGSGYAMTPIQAYTMDTKIDDGKPSTGGMHAVKWLTATNDIDNDDGAAGLYPAKTCVTTTTPHQYNVQDTTLQCLITVRM